MNQARINSRAVTIRPGETILDAASRMGIEIPTLCHATGLKPTGACRICLVHSGDHDRPLGACHTPLESGMDLQTHHVEVEKWRASILKMHLETASVTGFRSASIRPGSRLRELLERYGIRDRAASRVTLASDADAAERRDRSHPMIRFDASACVSCGVCVDACDVLAGQSAFQVAGPGAAVRITPLAGGDLRETPCTACGACLDRCPTGAVSERRGRFSRTNDDEPRTVDSVCGYCSVGCRIRVESVEETVIGVAGIAGESATNPNGLLCQKGRFSHGFNKSWDRLSQPMIRQGAGFREISWEEALSVVETRLREITAVHGYGSFGALASTRASTESNYLLQKFCRSVMGSPHIDSSARLCHAPSAEVLRRTLGLGAGTASFADIDRADCLVVAGADPDTSHPVLASRIRKAVREGAWLLVIDPRRTALAELADCHLQIPPGTDRNVFDALASALIKWGLFDESFVETRTANGSPLRAALAGIDAAEVCRHAEIPDEAFGAAVESLGRHRGSTLFLHGTGLTQRADGTETVQALLHLALLTGNIGKPGAGFLPLGGQNNLQGCLDAGADPFLLPGHQPIEDPAARERIESLWGFPLPEATGLTGPEMIAAAARGEIRAMWIMGHDAAHSQADEAGTAAALANLDFLVVQDLFYSEAARHAHLLLPAASSFEQEGVFINAERRVQVVRPAVAPPEQARPDWAILTLAARRLGVPWPYQDSAQVLAEWALTAPEFFAGITRRRLEEHPEGIQWPCPRPEHPGTPTLHAEAFRFGDGRARFQAPAGPEGSREADPEFPWVLITGRRLEHHNAGAMTRRGTARLLTDRDRVTLHPGDARKLGVEAGDLVTIESRHGATSVEADCSDRIRRGTVFLTLHFTQTHANRLVKSPAEGPTGSPSFKGTPVRVRRSVSGESSPNPISPDFPVAKE